VRLLADEGLDPLAIACQKNTRSPNCRRRASRVTLTSTIRIYNINRMKRLRSLAVILLCTRTSSELAALRKRPGH
jgi:hypothetical protein